MWVYTLVNTDYDGSKLLPHFLNYYHGREHVGGALLTTAAAARSPVAAACLHGAPAAPTAGRHPRVACPPRATQRTA